MKPRIGRQKPPTGWIIGLSNSCVSNYPTLEWFKRWKTWYHPWKLGITLNCCCYNLFLVRKMVTSVILHEKLCTVTADCNSTGCRPVLEELSIWFSAMEFHLDLIVVFHMILAKNIILSSPLPRVSCRSDDGYRPVHMYGNLKTAILEILIA